MLCSAVTVPVCVPVAVPDFVDGAGEGDGDRLRVPLVAVGFAVALCFGAAVGFAVVLGFGVAFGVDAPEAAGLDTRLWAGLGLWV